MSTLVEVAQKAGVSPSLVSRVLSNRMGNTRVSAAKQAQILEICREVGYVPSRFAQGLATRKAGAIALIAPEPAPESRLDAWNSHYLHVIMSGIELECSRVGYHCVLSHWTFDSAGLSHPRPMLDKSVDGVVLADFTRGGVVRDLISLGLPCVQIGSNIESSVPIDRYYGDAKSAMCQVVVHLAEVGCRRIHLFGGVGPGPQEIADACLDTGKKLAGIKVEARSIPRNDPHQIELLAVEMASDASMAGYIFLSAPIAMQFAAAMTRLGRICPRDYSLVGMKVEGWPDIYLPGLGLSMATIVLPNHQVARAATRDLLACIQAEKSSVPASRSHLWPCHIDWAQSVAGNHPQNNRPDNVSGV